MRHSRALCFLCLLLATLPAAALEVAWVRVLADEAEPLLWMPGTPWPGRPAGFSYAPSAVLSYASFFPGDDMSATELESRSRAWERSLEESGRFTRASVYIVEIDGSPDARGAIIEAASGATPCFDGGAAYASMTLPLVGGKRASLAMEAGANRAAVFYRDDAFCDLPIVLATGLRYDNDLLETGLFAGNRLSGSLGLGPRLGPLGDLLLRGRCAFPLDDSAGALVSVDVVLELSALSLFDLRGLDFSFSASGSAYPGTSALRFLAGSVLQLALGRWDLSCEAGLGLSAGELDSRELFAMDSGELELRGPEGDDRDVSDAAIIRLEGGLEALRWNFASWLSASLGPFAFAEAALVAPTALLDWASAAETIGGLGGGLRLKLGSPIGLTVDLGYSVDRVGEGSLVFSATSRKFF
jgi:hypothetical protein